MTRLHNDMRGNITTAVIKHRFLPEAQSIISDNAALAVEIYEDVYSDDLQRMNELPGGWLPENSSITINSGGETHTLWFDGSQRHGSSWLFREVDKQQVELRVLSVKSNKRTSYIAKSPIAKKIDEMNSRVVSFHEQSSRAERETRAMLDKFTTVEKLIEGWPEIEPFIPAKQKPVNLPAVPTDHLNALLNLPTGD